VNGDDKAARKRIHSRPRGKGTIVVGGALVAQPDSGGHAWVFLRYLLGFRRLGWRVLFLDMVHEAQGDAAAQAEYLTSVMRAFELESRFALLRAGSLETVGMSRSELLEEVGSCAMFLNVMGYVSDPDVLAAAPRRVFLDIDPGFPQMWRELGLHDAFDGYDDCVTIGENIGQPDCEIPKCGIDWTTTSQPVVMDLWPSAPGGDRISSVVTWRGAFGPIEFRGKTYGLRAHEFRDYATVPKLVGGSPYELALRIDPSETADIGLLREGGWSLIDPRAVAGDPISYRRYVQSSRAEFMVAKNLYVQTRSGWFSDRSACYLASGKPVVAQNTGIEHRYPVGDGLITFSSLEEAVSGVQEVLGNYAHHSACARELAHEYFDSDKVLGGLLDRLEIR
jgi:hypothetical protein